MQGPSLDVRFWRLKTVPVLKGLTSKSHVMVWNVFCWLRFFRVCFNVNVWRWFKILEYFSFHIILTCYEKTAKSKWIWQSQWPPAPPPPLKSKVSLHRCADLWLVREPGKRVFSSLRFCELGKSYAWKKVNLVKNMARDFINLPQSRQGTSSWALLDIRNEDAAKIWQLLPISQGVPRSNTHKAPSDARFKGIVSKAFINQAYIPESTSCTFVQRIDSVSLSRGYTWAKCFFKVIIF